MTAFVQRAARDPERLSFESEVVARDGDIVELAETYFFAESGGQPPDRGTIDNRQVTDVRFETDRIVHELESGDGLTVGDTVSGTIDPLFRRYCRRAHTASHVLYGAARRELEALGYGGFEIDDRKVRIDFESREGIDDEQMIAIEQRANEVVWESRRVRWEQLPQQAAIADDAVAFNIATEDIFEQTETVRIVEVEGWDRAACGGTHVTNTQEIGPITVLGRSNPGSGLTRIEFAVGPTAIGQRATERAAMRRVAHRLNVQPSMIDEAVEQLETQRSADRNRIDALEQQLLAERIDEFERRELGDHVWGVGRLPDVTSDTTSAVLRETLQTDGLSVIVGVTGDDRTTITVASDGRFDADTIVNRVTGTLGGGGGGDETFAQGGGIPETPDEVIGTLTGVIEEISE